MITIKSPSEVEKMRVAGRIVGDVLNMLESHIQVGISTLELNNIAESYILSKNATCSFKGYNGFPYCCCISINEEVIHGFPSNRKLKMGDIVSVDVGACYNGFHGDAARTFGVGEISKEAKKMIETAKECFFKAIKNAISGKRISDIAKSTYVEASKNGCDVVRTFNGHGIGRNLHEEPSIPNYIMKRKGERLAPGMTLAIEPMITAGKGEVEILKDGWTVVTKDRKLSSHYENTVLITEHDPEILTYN